MELFSAHTTGGERWLTLQCVPKMYSKRQHRQNEINKQLLSLCLDTGLTYYGISPDCGWHAPPVCLEFNNCRMKRTNKMVEVSCGIALFQTCTLLAPAHLFASSQHHFDNSYHSTDILLARRPCFWVSRRYNPLPCRKWIGFPRRALTRRHTFWSCPDCRKSLFQTCCKPIR